MRVNVCGLAPIISDFELIGDVAFGEH